MQDAYNANGNADNTGKDNNRAPQPWLKWIIIGGLTVVIALALVSYFHPYMEERFKFWAATAVNALILTAILVQVYVYTKQWEAMQDGLKETRSLVVQNESMVRAMQRQIRIARSQVRQSYKQVDLMRDSLTETRNLVAQNERAVKAAEHGTETTRQSMIYAQRAWVTMGGVSVSFTEEGIRFALHVRNSGNTPANNVRFSYVTEICLQRPDVRDLTKPGYENEREPVLVQIGMIGPGDSFRLETVPRKAHPQEVEDIDARTHILYLQALIDYKDVFEQSRVTRALWIHTPGRIDLSPWEEGNKAE